MTKFLFITMVVFSGWSLGQNQVSSIEEMTGRDVLAVAEGADSILVITWGAEGISISLSYWIVDKETAAVTLVDDGRIPRATRAVAFGDSFGLVETMSQRVATVDARGQFLDVTRLNRWFSFDDDINLDRVVQMSPFLNGTTLVTAEDYQSGYLWAIQLDFEKKMFEVLHGEPFDKEFTRSYWFSDGMYVYYINTESLEILLVDEVTFTVKKTLQKARKPVPRKMERLSSADIDQRAMMPKYNQLLLNPIVPKMGKIVFSVNRFRDFPGAMMKRYKKEILVVQEEAVTFRRDSLEKTITTFHEKALIFDLEEQEFSLKKYP